MKTIWKFPFKTTDDFQLEMPAGARILSMKTQHDGSPCMWAEVDPHNNIEKRSFQVYGTGYKHTGHKKRYLGMYTEYNDGLVWHVYELIS